MQLISALYNFVTVLKELFTQFCADARIPYKSTRKFSILNKEGKI